MGTGGNNMPMVAEVFPIQGTVIGRSDEAGPQGKGFANDGEPMFTLDRVSGHGVATFLPEAWLTILSWVLIDSEVATPALWSTWNE